MTTSDDCDVELPKFVPTTQSGNSIEIRDCGHEIVRRNASGSDLVVLLDKSLTPNSKLVIKVKKVNGLYDTKNRVCHMNVSAKDRFGFVFGVSSLSPTKQLKQVDCTNQINDLKSSEKLQVDFNSKVDDVITINRLQSGNIVIRSATDRIMMSLEHLAAVELIYPFFYLNGRIDGIELVQFFRRAKSLCEENAPPTLAKRLKAEPAEN